MGLSSSRSHPWHLLLGSCLLFCLLLATASVRATFAFAQQAPLSPVHFHSQTRIGFASGDDWEPALTSDRFGHLYALYKHYDVTGGQTCKGCDIHLLFQRSSDWGQTWSTPTPIAP